MCHILPLIFVIGILSMGNLWVGIVLYVAFIGIKAAFTTGDKWLTSMLIFMVISIVINTIT